MVGHVSLRKIGVDIALRSLFEYISVATDRDSS